MSATLKRPETYMPRSPPQWSAANDAFRVLRLSLNLKSKGAQSDRQFFRQDMVFFFFILCYIIPFLYSSHVPHSLYLKSVVLGLIFAQGIFQSSGCPDRELFHLIPVTGENVPCLLITQNLPVWAFDSTDLSWVVNILVISLAARHIQNCNVQVLLIRHFHPFVFEKKNKKKKIFKT